VPWITKDAIHARKPYRMMFMSTSTDMIVLLSELMVTLETRSVKFPQIFALTSPVSKSIILGYEENIVRGTNGKPALTAKQEKH